MPDEPTQTTETTTTNSDGSDQTTNDGGTSTLNSLYNNSNHNEDTKNENTEGGPGEGQNETDTGEEGSQEGAGQGGGEGGKPEGAPDKYTDWSLPEGFKLDQALNDSFQEVARELNLSQDQAQKLVDLQAKSVQDMAKGQVDAWNSVVQDWGNQLKNDPDIGGQKFQESVSIANKPIEEFGSVALREALDLTGAGSHPEVFRFFHKMGKAMSEGTLVNQSGTPGDKGEGTNEFSRAARNIYSNSNHK